MACRADVTLGKWTLYLKIRKKKRWTIFEDTYNDITITALRALESQIYFNAKLAYAAFLFSYREKSLPAFGMNYTVCLGLVSGETLFTNTYVLFSMPEVKQTNSPKKSKNKQTKNTPKQSNKKISINSYVSNHIATMCGAHLWKAKSPKLIFSFSKRKKNYWGEEKNWTEIIYHVFTYLSFIAMLYIT